MWMDKKFKRIKSSDLILGKTVLRLCQEKDTEWNAHLTLYMIWKKLDPYNIYIKAHKLACRGPADANYVLASACILYEFQGAVDRFNEQQVIHSTGVYKRESEELQTTWILGCTAEEQEGAKLCTLFQLLLF